MAGFTKTASRPSSITSAAWEGRPSPASTTTGGRLAFSRAKSSKRALVLTPQPEPMGAARGITVAVPRAASLLARTRSGPM